MPWFNVDDGFADHPKVVSLQSEDCWHSALALWTISGSWSAKHLTDGFVPNAIVMRSGCSTRDAELLVKVGLWEAADGGYRFHGWEERNPLRADVEARRKVNREKTAKSRRSKVTHRGSDQVGDQGSNLVGNQVCNRLHDGLHTQLQDGLVTGNPEWSGSLSSGSLSEISESTDRAKPVWSAARQQVVFRAMFEPVHQTMPGMGGKSVGEFHGQVVRTAELQQRDPEELFREVLGRWLEGGLTEIARKAPYACFQQAWGDLTSKGAKSPSRPPGGAANGMRGRLSPAPPAPASAFEGEEDIEVTMARWKNG